MKTVVRAGVYGFCMGVRKAVEKSLQEAERNKTKPDGGQRVYTMGPLIHNPDVLSLLAGRGIGILDESRLPDRLDGATVVIRAHGVAPSLVRKLGERGAHVVDATCPRVRMSQNKAAAYSRQGYTVILAGEANHGEIIGIAGYVPGCLIVSTPQEAAEVARRLRNASPDAKLALIGQTTLTREEYKGIALELEKDFPVIEVFDSICQATADRQNALASLCEGCDAIVVVGGMNSANTKRLYSSAISQGKPAWHVEGVSGLPEELRAYKKIGLTAGASTPDWIIDEVEAHLLSL